MPTRHQRNAVLTAVGDGHVTIVPRMSLGITTRGEFYSR